MKLIIEGYNKSIHKKDNQLVIHEKDEVLDSIKASSVTDITITGKGHITFDALNLIAENNIKLIAIDPRGMLKYCIESPDARNIKLKKQQYKLSENIKGLEISKELIKCKMRNQKATLKTLNKNKNLKRVEKSKEKITEYITELENIDLIGDNETIRMKIMGIEGKTSHEYWNAIKYLVPKEIEFKNRTKQTTDLLNSMLNYGYAILASEITKSILLKGLDPYCGFLHYDMDKRTSLTFDLIEPFRQQIVDKSMIALINRKQITKMDIDKRNNLIKLDARRIIANKIFSKLYSTITYNEESLTYADIIRKQSDNLVKTLLYNQKFESFYLRW